MPGIFGVVDLAVERPERRHHEAQGLLTRMAVAMLYEPFYSSELVECRELGAYFGRVAFGADMSATHQRHVVDAGATALVTGFALARTSAASAAQSLVQTPVECELVKLFGPGITGLASLVGIHSGVVVDHARRSCVIFNDKYGKERIYLHTSGQRLMFSSEAKAILAVAPETRAFDARGLAEILTCGCTIGERSLFAGIDVLPSGTAVTIEHGRIRREQYFDRRSLESLPAKSERDFLAEFPERLQAAVARNLQTTPSPAVSLTGGIDSRMVLAAADESATIPTYTFGSMYRTTADVAVARQVAGACKQSHAVIELGSDFLRHLPDVFSHAVYVSDGYLGLSGAAELYVNRKARSISAARMTGNWGGELMRGVRAFKAVMPRGGFVTEELAAEMLNSAVRMADPQNPVSACLFQQMPHQGYGRNAVERSQMLMRHPFLDDDVVRCLFQSPEGLRATNATAASVLGRRPQLLAIPTDRGVFVHRESRVRRATREALIKAEYMTSHGAPGWVARLSSAVPPALLEKRFLGIDKFQHFRYWMRHDVSAYVRDTLLRQSGVGGWFDQQRVRRMVDDHINGRDNYTNELDRLMTLALTESTLFRDAQVKAA